MSRLPRGQVSRLTQVSGHTLLSSLRFTRRLVEHTYSPLCPTLLDCILVFFVDLIPTPFTQIAVLQAESRVDPHLLVCTLITVSPASRPRQHDLGSRPGHRSGWFLRLVELIPQRSTSLDRQSHKSFSKQAGDANAPGPAPETRRRHSLSVDPSRA